MIAAPVFHIVSEFKFEIGSALLGTEALKNAVGGVSSAADNALVSFQKLGFGIAAQMGLGTGGILGMLYEAIQASEKFGATQRKLANVFLSNQDKISGGPVTFMEAMQASSDIMDEIHKKAAQFGLPASALANTVGAIAPALFNEGVAGKNLGPAIDMSRGLLKSAPVLGVDPNMVQGQLLDLVNGRGSAGDTLAMRLMNETTAFKEFGGGKHNGGSSAGKSPLAAFNALPAAKRVEVLNKALLQFGSNTDILKANASSLTQQIQILSDSMKGMFSILKPIGESLASFLAPALERFNQMIQTNGVQIGKQLGIMAKKMLGDNPEKLFAGLFQAGNLKKDLASTANVFSMVGIVGTIGMGLKWLGVTAKLASPWISAFVGMFTIFLDVFERTPTIMTKVSLWVAGITAIGVALVAFPGVGVVLAIGAALTGLFQLFSRAEGYAKVNDALKIPALTEKLLRASNAFMAVAGSILAPFTAIFDALAKWIAPMFEISSWIDLAADSLITLATLMSVFDGQIQGLGATVREFLRYLTHEDMIKNPTGIFSSSGKAFTDTFDKVMNENLATLQSGETANVSKSITNIGKVEIRNDFKQQMEPDRIAFTIKDQLLKAAANPGQSANRSLRGTFGTAGN